jgi:hypothetical protein
MHYEGRSRSEKRNREDEAKNLGQDGGESRHLRCFAIRERQNELSKQKGANLKEAHSARSRSFAARTSTFSA